VPSPAAPGVTGAESTPPPAPPAAHAVFGDALDRAVAYAGLLAGEAVTRGLIGPREVPRLWERHLLNCAVLAGALPDGGRVVDLGSGAGLPGVVLALLRPDCTFELVDATRRRTDFLGEVTAALGLGNASVHWARAEQLAGSIAADAVVARAVAPLDRLVAWAVPLLRPGGELIAVKGAGAAAEVAETRDAVRRAGGGEAHIEEWGAGVVEPPATVVRVTRVIAGGGRPKGGRRG